MKTNFFVCNGILTDPSDINGWTDIFEDLYQNMGFPCTRYEYFSGVLSRFLKQGKRVEEIVYMLKRITNPLVFVGHSNGCELFDRVIRTSDIKFEAAHLFAPAMNADFNDNGLNYAILSGRVKHVYLYCSKGDRALRDWASKTSFLKIIGLGYGTLGYCGPKNVLNLVENRVFTDWENRYDHSDWFSHNNIDRWFAATLRK